MIFSVPHRKPFGIYLKLGMITLLFPKLYTEDPLHYLNSQTVEYT